MSPLEKVWNVYCHSTPKCLGQVWATHKYIAMAKAEKQFCLTPPHYWVGRADGLGKPAKEPRK